MTILRSHESSLAGPSETESYGAQLGRLCQGGERIALVGELGAGKTTFMRGFAQGLGLDPDEISSPTFTLVDVHAPTSAGLQLVHADAYRLESVDQLDAVGWEEHLADRRSIVVLEWPQNVKGALGDRPIIIELSYDAPDQNGAIGRLVRCIVPPRGPGELQSRSCPTCSTLVESNESCFPFCSSRCRLADLGSWFSGDYSISREIEEDDLIDPRGG